MKVTTYANFLRTLRQGMHDLKVWANVEADGAPPTTTPGKTSGKEDEMGRLAKVSYNWFIMLAGL